MAQNLTHEERLSELTRGIAIIIRDNPITGAQLAAGILSWDGARDEHAWLTTAEARLKVMLVLNSGP